MAFDLCQRHISRQLAQLVQERAVYSKAHNLLGARMEVTASSFPQDVQDNQAINEYQQVYSAAIACSTSSRS